MAAMMILDAGQGYLRGITSAHPLLLPPLGERVKGLFSSLAKVTCWASLWPAQVARSKHLCYSWHS